jgi:hypothetical protein
MNILRSEGRVYTPESTGVQVYSKLVPLDAYRLDAQVLPREARSDEFLDRTKPRHIRFGLGSEPS